MVVHDDGGRGAEVHGAAVRGVVARDAVARGVEDHGGEVHGVVAHDDGRGAVEVTS